MQATITCQTSPSNISAPSTRTHHRERLAGSGRPDRADAVGQRPVPGLQRLGAPARDRGQARGRRCSRTAARPRAARAPTAATTHPGRRQPRRLDGIELEPVDPREVVGGATRDDAPAGRPVRSPIAATGAMVPSPPSTTIRSGAPDGLARAATPVTSASGIRPNQRRGSSAPASEAGLTTRAIRTSLEDLVRPTPARRQAAADHRLATHGRTGPTTRLARGVRPHRPHRGRGRRPRVRDRAPYAGLRHAARAPRDDRGAGRRGRAARRRREPRGAADAPRRRHAGRAASWPLGGPGLHHVAYQVERRGRRARRGARCGIAADRRGAAHRHPREPGRVPAPEDRRRRPDRARPARGGT